MLASLITNRTIKLFYLSHNSKFWRLKLRIGFEEAEAIDILWQINSALFHGNCPAPNFYIRPAPLSSYLEVALYKFHR